MNKDGIANKVRNKLLTDITDLFYSAGYFARLCEGGVDNERHDQMIHRIYCLESLVRCLVFSSDYTSIGTALQDYAKEYGLDESPANEIPQEEE